MPTKRIFVVAALAMLCACNTKKQPAVAAEKTLPENAPILIPAAVTVAADINNLCNTFISSVTQKFTVTGYSPVTITAKKGLRVNIVPGNLQTEDGEAVADAVTVNIVELTTPDDLFKSNAATMSNGRLLQSGGSYYIGMESGGKKLQLKNGKTLQVDFPQLKEEGMELFYGERNTDGIMNWVSANQQLIPAPVQDEMSFTDNNGTYDAAPAVPFMQGKQYLIYKSLNEEVYLYDKKMTIKDLLDSINKNEKRIYVDSVFMWPKEVKNLTDVRIDSNFLRGLYGPAWQFMLKTVKAKQQELDYAKKRKEMLQQAVDKWQPQSLSGQIQKYYSTSAITTLGWINCDRFNNNPQQQDVPVELPYTFTKGSMQYFIIYKSFNGLMSGKLNFEKPQTAIEKLPVGEPVTLIAFTKKDGEIWQCKKQFTIEKNTAVKLSFEKVEAEDIKKIFGNNVRI